MKDHTQNYSSPPCTPSNNSEAKSLYVVTGKGGVGKTTISLALAHFLKKQGKKVLYMSFNGGVSSSLCEKLELPFLRLTVHKSAELYIAKKLRSKLLASWVMKTPFFLGLFNMIPGLGHMIFFGHIINLLEADPALTIVLDSPSSGHTLTMFEASFNFLEIFGEGVLVKDIIGMHAFLKRNNVLKVLISCLPTAMAINEGRELKEGLEAYGANDIELIINDAFFKMEGIEASSLPFFLQKKIHLEKEVIAKKGQLGDTILPHLTSLKNDEIVKALSPLMKGL